MAIGGPTSVRAAGCGRRLAGPWVDVLAAELLDHPAVGLDRKPPLTGFAGPAAASVGAGEVEGGQ